MSSPTPRRSLSPAAAGALVLVVGQILFWLPLVAFGVKPGRYSADSSPHIVLSVLQMAAISFLSFKLYRLLRGDQEAPGAEADYRLWLLLGIAFAYLGVDELVRIHENVALWIRRGFHLPENGLTSRLDDLIILGYGIAGAAVLIRFRKELRRLLSGRNFIIAGLVVAFLMAGLDLLTNRKDVLWAVFPGDVARKLYRWGGVWEEACKILAQGLFLTGFYSAWYAASQPHPASEGAAGDPSTEPAPQA